MRLNAVLVLPLLMFRFQHPEHLLALLLLPLVWLLWWRVAAWRKGTRQKAGDARLVDSWLGGTAGGTRFSTALLSATLALITLGWAGPYRPSEAVRENVRGRDLLIALDVSKSMLARDVGPDRLTAARALIAALAQRLEGDRIGLLLFAGRAYLQLPLTTDRSALLTLLPTIRPEDVPTGGTAVAEALRTAVQAFPEKAATGRVLVLVSDGEDHGGDAQDAAVNAVQEGGLTIHTVGIGSPEGTTLFDPDTRAPRTDEEGRTVVSKLDEKGLRAIAQRGGGRYLRMKDAESTSQALAGAIAQTPARAGYGAAGSDREQLFYFALLPAFVLLLIAMLSRRKKKLTAVIIAVLTTLSPSVFAQERQLRKGNEHYRAGRYREADEAYTRALAKDSLNPRGRFNRGAALYQQKNYDAARGSMNAAAALAKDAATKGAALYNIGNTYGAEQKWKDAADAYKGSLRARPGDRDAQYNLSYALQKLRAQQEQQKQNQQQQNQPQQKQNPQPQKPKPGDEKEEQQPAPGAMSKEGAERILSALREEEKRVREREQDEKSRAASHPEKDW